MQKHKLYSNTKKLFKCTSHKSFLVVSLRMSIAYTEKLMYITPLDASTTFETVIFKHKIKRNNRQTKIVYAYFVCMKFINHIVLMQTFDIDFSLRILLSIVVKSFDLFFKMSTQTILCMLAYLSKIHMRDLLSCSLHITLVLFIR